VVVYFVSGEYKDGLNEHNLIGNLKGFENLAIWYAFCWKGHHHCQRDRNFCRVYELTLRKWETVDGGKAGKETWWLSWWWGGGEGIGGNY